MVEDTVQRRLAAILAADVVGYSLLMGQDETGTLATLRNLQAELIDPKVTAHQGRLFKTTGDGFLVEFPSVVNAVACAVDIQKAMAERNANQPEGRRIQFRIGVNLGDVIIEGDDVFGDGVNVAARLEGVAQPGGIVVSGTVRDHLGSKLDLQFEDKGEHALKNIETPVRLYAVQMVASSSTSRIALSLPDKPSIAVLPFQNMSGDVEQEYFSDGITEDIITALSKLRWFFVIARNSTFGYKNKTPDIRQVARDLGVRYVLEGSVRKSGDRLRVTSQLIDATTGTHVWAERYDRAVADLFAVQDEITENVVASIESQLFAAEHVRTRSRPTESLDAWGCVIQAMPHVWTWAAHDSEIGIVLLNRAIALDPNYARANSLLAWAYAARGHLGKADPVSELKTAEAIARRAIEQDGDDSWAHTAMGYVHMVSRRFEPATASLKEAIERSPNFAFAHMILGSAYGYGGRAADGLHHLAIAARLSPRDHVEGATLSTAGLCHFMTGNYNEAANLQRRAVQLRPNFGTAWRTLAASAGLAGDVDTAAAALAEAKRLQPNLTIGWVREFHPIIMADDRERYVEGLRKAGLAE